MTDVCGVFGCLVSQRDQTTAPSGIYTICLSTHRCLTHCRRTFYFQFRLGFEIRCREKRSNQDHAQHRNIFEFANHWKSDEARKGHRGIAVLTQTDSFEKMTSFATKYPQNVTSVYYENQVNAIFEKFGKTRNKVWSSPCQYLLSRRTIQLKLCILNKCVTSNISAISF